MWSITSLHDLFLSPYFLQTSKHSLVNSVIVTHLSCDVIFLELAGSHVLLNRRKFLVIDAVLGLTSSAMMVCFRLVTKLDRLSKLLSFVYNFATFFLSAAAVETFRTRPPAAMKRVHNFSSWRPLRLSCTCRVSSWKLYKNKHRYRCVANVWSHVARKDSDSVFRSQQYVCIKWQLTPIVTRFRLVEPKHAFFIDHSSSLKLKPSWHTLSWLKNEICLISRQNTHELNLVANISLKK